MEPSRKPFNGDVALNIISSSDGTTEEFFDAEDGRDDFAQQPLVSASLNPSNAKALQGPQYSPSLILPAGLEARIKEQKEEDARRAKFAIEQKERDAARDKKAAQDARESRLKEQVYLDAQKKKERDRKREIEAGAEMTPLEVANERLERERERGREIERQRAREELERMKEASHARLMAVGEESRKKLRSDPLDMRALEVLYGTTNPDENPELQAYFDQLAERDERFAHLSSSDPLVKLKQEILEGREEMKEYISKPKGQGFVTRTDERREAQAQQERERAYKKELDAMTQRELQQTLTELKYKLRDAALAHSNKMRQQRRR